MNIIDLATKTMQTAIQTAITGVRSVVDATKTKVDSTATKVDAIDVKVGTLLDGRVVKSIQRGVTIGDNINRTTTVNINSVNPSKSLILINGSYGYENATTKVPYEPYVTSFNSTNFTVSRQAIATNSQEFSWQVIEFY